MKKIKDIVKNTIIINKSEFITYLYPVSSIEEINQILSNIKKEYYDATHHVYAYILGKNQEIQKANDDGEPQKTAGYPMLDVLKKQNLTDILSITIRYFGGILLGAGGLVRAYSQSVSEALKKTKLYEIKLLNQYKLCLSYSNYNSILPLLKKYEILDSIFQDLVVLYIGVSDKDKDLFLNQISEATNGNAICDFINKIQTLTLCENI